nr:hypothetical protein GCM10020092_066110 [Actinoplanes digitatis]
MKRAARGSAPARKPATKGGAAAAADSRAYRRMPDDLAAVYRQAGTAAAIADHYDVPPGTPCRAGSGG